MLTRRTFLAGAAAAAKSAPPNIVVLLADDLGSNDLSSYAAPDIRTPAIDSIGRAGLRFSQFYANAPECTPTRTALLTGRYQQRVGGLECAIGVGNVGRYDEAAWLAERGELGLPAEPATLAAQLRARGYSTALIGKWHLGYAEQFSPRRHGFDEACYIEGGNADYFRHTEQSGGHVLRRNGAPLHIEGRYLTEFFGSEAVAWLGRQRQRPYFLYLPFNAPHSPYQGPEDRDKAGNLEKGSHETYVRMVEAMDRQVVRVLQAVAESGAERNTLVVFMSDNGAPRPGSNAPLRGWKSECWEGGIRVPCMLRWPAAIPAGGETAQVALTMDVTATLLAAAGARPAAPLDGIDLLPHLRGARPATPRTVFWRYKRMQNVRKAVRDGDLKLVVDNGAESLHDLSADLREEHPLNAARPADLKRLRERLAAWEREVEAPRLRYAQQGGKP